MKKILLDGYYNHGNYGDDLLMMVSINFLKEMGVEFRMHAKHLQFFDSFICNSSTGDENLIVKGGGGLFFDFKKEAIFKDRIFNKLFSIPLFRKLAYFKLKANTDTVLLGVGIGPYSDKSSRLWRQLLSMEAVKLFCLRDQESVNFALAKGFTNVIQTTDLVFNTHLWSQYNQVKKQSIAKKVNKVGIVFRKWMYYDINYEAILSELVKAYGKNQVVLYFLQDSDTVVVKDFNQYEHYIYQQGKEAQLTTFTNALSEVDLIYTMRAHGAIVGSCLNIPTVILPIENKLKNVHQMIPDISYLNPDLYTYDFDAINTWYETLEITTFEERTKRNQEMWDSKLATIKKSLTHA